MARLYGPKKLSPVLKITDIYRPSLRAQKIIARPKNHQNLSPFLRGPKNYRPS